MKFNNNYTPSLAGSLLIAHPAMIDPRFKQSVILLSAHSSSGGLGVVINSPTNKTMSDFDFKYLSTPLSFVPIFIGGPIQTDSIILAAWEWSEHDSVFKLHFGISEEEASRLITMIPNIEVKAFLGHSEWIKGQLENELATHTWLLSSVKNLRASKAIKSLWKNIIAKIKPELLFLVDPDDPSLN